jgi:hypothetical protein
MRKVWVLDTETKGTGANVVPLERTLQKAQPSRDARSRKRSPRPAGPRRAARAPEPPADKSSTPLPPGHVRKKATGELGRVRAVDPRAGTATVHWLRDGRTSTVPLTAISRR